MATRPTGPRMPARHGSYGAAYQPGDDARLVQGAFACPRCLRRVPAIALVDADEVPVAELSCRPCARLWQVELTLPQVLALALMPAPGLELSLGPQATRLRDLASFGDEDVGA